MGNIWACEICGRQGLPSEPVVISNGAEVPVGKVELFTYNMGVYAIRVCSLCWQELGEEGLRQKLREKVRRMQDTGTGG